MNLKSTLYFLLGGLLTTTMLLAESSKPSFSLTISTPTSTVVAGSQVRIDIERKNTSDHPINVAQMVSDNQGELDYHVIVRNAQDQEPPETKWGRRLHGKEGEGDAHDGVSIVSGHLPPGEVLHEFTVLNRIYDLSVPGQYTVRVERRDPDQKVMVKSNTLTITVTK